MKKWPQPILACLTDGNSTSLGSSHPTADALLALDEELEPEQRGMSAASDDRIDRKVAAHAHAHAPAPAPAARVTTNRELKSLTETYKKLGCCCCGGSSNSGKSSVQCVTARPVKISNGAEIEEGFEYVQPCCCRFKRCHVHISVLQCIKPLHNIYNIIFSIFIYILNYSCTE